MDAALTLDQLAISKPAHILSIDWSGLAEEEVLRLRALGFEPGSEVAVAYRGVFGGRDPLAVRIGRMTVALRRTHARAMQVAPLP